MYKAVSYCRLRLADAEAKETPSKAAPAKEASAKDAPSRLAEDLSQKKADSAPYKPDTDWKSKYAMHGIYTIPADQVRSELNNCVTGCLHIMHDM